METVAKAPADCCYGNRCFSGKCVFQWAPAYSQASTCFTLLANLYLALRIGYSHRGVRFLVLICFLRLRKPPTATTHPQKIRTRRGGGEEEEGWGAGMDGRANGQMDEWWEIGREKSLNLTTQPNLLEQCFPKVGCRSQSNGPLVARN